MPAELLGPLFDGPGLQSGLRAATVPSRRQLLPPLGGAQEETRLPVFSVTLSTPSGFQSL